MKRVTAALLLLGIQLALVLSIAGKYLHERRTRPRVWVRAAQYDPQRPLRGRYLALQPVVDACALPRDEEHLNRYEVYPRTSKAGAWSWQVELVAQSGHLTPTAQPAEGREGTSTVHLNAGDNCERARVNEQLEYFIPEHARTPFPLAAGQELWVEVTVPMFGPPRPIQLATSGVGGFAPLRFGQ